MAAEHQQQLLAQLADIAEPAYELSWQIPPGVYLLLALLLAALSYSGWKLNHYWQQGKAKRQALSEFGQLSPHAVAEINQLLKRVVQSYAPAHPVLTGSANQWQHFLQQQLPTEPLPDLTMLLYNSTQEDATCRQFHQFAAIWLKQLRPATLAQINPTNKLTEVADG
tara:strand:+ start:352 stop:852 length:501 start_codon:yes stop_codon:yes gene_type:complete